MWSYKYTNELYHYGVKGMRWGVRRYEDKSGHLTAAGKKRYDDYEYNKKKSKKEYKAPDNKSKKEYKIPDNKSLHRMKIEEKYKQQGMTKKEAEQAAARRIRAEQYAAAAAAITVTACVAYCKHKNYVTDKTLSADTDFQRIMKMADGDVIKDGRQFLSYEKSDKSKYSGQLAGDLKKKAAANEKIYNVSIKAKQDIKIASQKRARDTFYDLYKNDEDFRKSLTKMAKDAGDDIPTPLKLTRDKLINNEKLSDKRIKNKVYDLFNVSLADNSPEGKERADKFYNALKKQGMNAIHDMNDMKYSGYNSKSPIIAFDGAYDYSKKVLSDKEIIESMTKPVGSTKRNIAAGMALVTYLGGIKVYNDRAVEKYKMEHPNTRLTDREIKSLLKYGE